MEKKTATILMRAGMGEGTDAAADQDNFRRIVNGRYDADGALLPRAGFTHLVDASAPGAGDPRGLLVTKNALGIVAAGSVVPYIPEVGLGQRSFRADAEISHNTYFYGAKRVRWLEAATLEVDDIVYTAVVSVEDDSEDSEAEAWVRLYAGDQLIDVEIVRSGGVVGARIIADQINGNFVVFHHEENNIAAVVYEPSTSALTVIDSFSVDTDVSADVAMDAFKDDNNYVYVVYSNHAETEINIKDYLAATFVTVAQITETATSAVAGLPVTGSKFALAYVDDSDDTRIWVFNGGAAIGQVDSDTGASVPLVANIGIYLQNFISATNFTVRVVTSDSDDFLGYYREQSANLVGSTVNASGVFINETFGAAAISKPTPAGTMVVRTTVVADGFYAAHFYNGNTYVQAGFASAVRLNTSALPAVRIDSDEYSFTFPAILRDDETAEFDARGQLITLDLKPNTLQSVTVGGVAYIAGSQPQVFDGVSTMSLSGAGVPVITVAQGTSSGALLEPGIYAYQAFLQISDTQGHLYYGPSSPTETVEITSGNHRVDVDVFNILLPSWALFDHTMILIYRTVKNGSAFHLVRSVRVNDFEVNYSFVDNMPDSELEANELIYSTSALESEPMPPLRAIWSTRNRLFGINAETPTQAWFTKEIADPIGPQWNAELVKRVENSGGELIAGGALGDKCVFFQRDQILVMSGEGPDATGENDTFSTPETIVLKVGAIDTTSIVQLPGGLLFRSSSGIYALGQDGALEFAGKDVLESERGLGDTVAAIYAPKLHQAWIAGRDTNEILVYDARHKRWSIFIPPFDFVRGMASFNDKVYLLDGDSQLWVYDLADPWDTDETATQFNFPVRIEAPWFRAGGHGGEFRVWRVILALAGGDEVPVLVETYTARPGQVLSKDPDMADDQYTVDIPDLPGPTEVRFRVVKQRASAFRCDVTLGNDEEVDDPPTSRPIRLIAIKYVFGTSSEDGKSPATTTAS